MIWTGVMTFFLTELRIICNYCEGKAPFTASA